MSQRSPGAPPTPGLLQGVDRLTIPVRNLAKAELFYTQVLGAEVVERDGTELGAEEQPCVHAQLCPGVELALVKQAFGWQPIDTSNPHVAFEIPGADVDRWVAHLAAWGVPSALVFREDYVVEIGVPTRVELHFLDPDGTQFELLAYDYPMDDRAARGHYNPWDLYYGPLAWPPPRT
ncbi:MAG: hypothetical protein QOF51_4247 [Chloroflexota bacterium]|nr:hypothetical protein [Chloroflexota bacterium]